MAGPRIRECRRVLAAADLGASHGFAAPYAYSIVNPGGTVRLVHVVEPFRRTNPLLGRYYQDLPTRKEHAQRWPNSSPVAFWPTEVAAGGIKTEVEGAQTWAAAKRRSVRRRSASTRMSEILHRQPYPPRVLPRDPGLEDCARCALTPVQTASAHRVAAGVEFYGHGEKQSTAEITRDLAKPRPLIISSTRHRVSISSGKMARSSNAASMAVPKDYEPLISAR
jgi:hypothetical protein